MCSGVGCAHDNRDKQSIYEQAAHCGCLIIFRLSLPGNPHFNPQVQQESIIADIKL